MRLIESLVLRDVLMGVGALNPATFLDQLMADLGLDQPGVAQTSARAIQILLVVVTTVWVARAASVRVRRRAKAGQIDVHAGALLSRAAGLGIYVIGAAIVIGILGASWTALAAVLGAATLGISLSLQDVGRSLVNGVYILVERPFRAGDLIRVGTTEGRVEDVGVRLTILRTDAGTRVAVPNSLIFTSMFENASVGRFDRQMFTLNNVSLAIAEIEDAVEATLQDIPYLSQRKPIVDIVATEPEGTTVEVIVEHEQGRRVSDQVISRLHDMFPEAAISAKAPASL